MRAAWIMLLAIPLFAGCREGIPEFEAGPLAGPGSGTVVAPIPAPDLESPSGPPASTVPVFTEAEIHHSYFPATPGRSWTYEGNSGRQHRRDEVRVLDTPVFVHGVFCTAIHQQVFLDGRLFEVTTEYYAADSEGNVWKFGEESAEWDGEIFRPASDPWMAGVDGATPWLLYPVEPKAGDVIRGQSSGGEEIFHVLATDAEIAVPAGFFANCLQLLENPHEEEDTDIILYAEDVGMVSEQSDDGRIDLVAHTGGS